MSIKMNLEELYFHKRDGSVIKVNAVVDKSASEAIAAIEEKAAEIMDGFPESLVDVNEKLNKKTNKQILEYNGTNITSDDVVQTFEQIYKYLINDPDFVILVHENKAYHPNIIDDEEIVFLSTFKSGGYNYVKIITINNNNVITLSDSKLEMTQNKTGEITEENKNSTDKYPNLKAVTNYIQPLKDTVTNLNKDLGTLEDLETVDKSCLVGAVNEVKRKVESAGTGTVKSVNGTSPDANGNVAITVPSKTSQLTNDSNYLTQHQSLSEYAKKTEVDNTYAKKTDIPTKNSQLQNDSGFLTQHQDLSTYAKKTEVDAERQRINQFVALQDGSTTGDAELQDIRVGYDGSTYDSAGDAVRGQVSQLSESIGEISSHVSELEDNVNNIIHFSDKTVTVENKNILERNPIGGGFSVSKSIDENLFACAGNGGDVNPYLTVNVQYGVSKWFIKFDYRYSKKTATGNPQKMRFILGSSDSYYKDIVESEWNEFSKIFNGDLTRLYFSLEGFEDKTSASGCELLIKNIVVVDINGLTDEQVLGVNRYFLKNYSVGFIDVPYNSDPAIGELLQKFVKDVAEDSNKIDKTFTNKNVLTVSVGGYGTSRIISGNKMIATSNGTDKNPAVRWDINFGDGKWLVRFKLKVSKNNATGMPEAIRIYLGANIYRTYNVAELNTDFCTIFDGDLTRIYAMLYNFSDASSGSGYSIEISDILVVDMNNPSLPTINEMIQSITDNYSVGEITVKSAVVNGIINAKNDGAIGDGETDDTISILSAVNSGAKKVFFPKGIYIFSGSISVPSGVELYGEGVDTIFKLADNYSLSELPYRGNSDMSYPYFYTFNSNNVVIRDVSIVGSVSDIKVKTQYGILFYNSTDCNAERVNVSNVNYDLTIQDGTQGLGLGYGIGTIKSKRISIIACNVSECGYECIGISDDSSNCVVRDCYTKNGWRCCIQVHRGCSDVLVDNCYMLQEITQCNACFTLHGVTEKGLKNIRLTNCVAIQKTVGTQPSDYNAPLQMMSHVDCLHVSNNRVESKKRAVYVNDSIENLIFTGNVIECGSNNDVCLRIESPNYTLIGNVVKKASGINIITPSENGVLVGNVGI